MCVCWRDLCEYSERMLRVSLFQAAPPKVISICSQKVSWGFQPRQPSLERIFYFPSGFLAGRWEINTPKAEPQHTGNLVKIRTFYQWNWLCYWIYPSYNIIRQFIPHPSPCTDCLERTNGQQWIYLHFTFSWWCSNIWKCQASLGGCICQMPRMF